MLKLLGKYASVARLWRRTHHKLMQYVGDDTILICGNERIYVYVDGRDASLTPSLLRDGRWGPELSAFLDRVLVPGSCFIDIGANNGIHALRAGRNVSGEGLVVAFEPQRRLLDLLQRSVCANTMVDRVHARCMAIGANEGIASLGKFAHLTGSASLTENSQIVEREEVAIAPLDVALSRIEAEIGRKIQPDVIKIDVEGFEYDVWDGMKEWTRGRDHLIVAIEYSPVSYRDKGRDALRLLTEFGEYGFKVAALKRFGRTAVLSRSQLEAMAMARRQFDLVLTKGG